MDERVLLERHDRLWEARSEVLGRWQAAVAARERSVQAARRHAVADEAAVRRAAGGLTARQRRWAERHLSYAARPRGREGRQVVVTWTYRREQIRTAQARADEKAAADAHAQAEADTELVEATAALLAAWGEEAAQVTGQPLRRLRGLAQAGV